VALAIDADGPGAVQDRLRRWAAVALLGGRRTALLAAGACEGGDDPGLQVEAADAPVGDVGDEQAALAVEDAVVGLDQPRLGARAAVAGGAALASARHGPHAAGLAVHLADADVESG